MALERIQWDEWIGRACKDHQILDPTWEQVEKVVRQLNEHRYSITNLDACENTGLLIGGGNGRFVIIAFVPDDECHLTGTNENAPITEIELTIGGQTGNYAGQIALDIETALKCAGRFWGDHSLETSVAWK